MCKVRCWRKKIPISLRSECCDVSRRGGTACSQHKGGGGEVDKIDNRDRFTARGEPRRDLEDRYTATWKREFKLPWRESGPLNNLDDKVDSDQ